MKIFLHEKGYYLQKDGSNIKMIILGRFLMRDAYCRTTFRDWAQTATDGDCFSSNITKVEIENDDILITDLHSEIQTELRMKVSQFIKLCDEWHEKVCKIKSKELKPNELEIIEDNNEFWIEIKR